METNNGGEVGWEMEDNLMRTATEIWKDDNGGAVEIQDNGDGRKVRMWRHAVDDCGGGYARQRGQQQQRYRKMGIAEEETPDGR